MARPAGCRAARRMTQGTRATISSAFALALFGTMLLVPAHLGPARGAEADALVGSEPARIAVELNRLEALDGLCLTYLVATNGLETPISELGLEVYLFDREGIIRTRTAFVFDDLRPRRQRVALFELDGVSCDAIGRLLVNDVIACLDPEGAPIGGCSDLLEVRSRTEVPLQY